VSGVYVACFLDPDTASQYAVDGGEPAASLHVTLAAYGELDPDALALVQQAAARVAFTTPPLQGVSPGYGIFRTTDGTPDVFIALVDVPGLFQLRDCLIDLLCDQGIDPLTDHDWTPHITLAYIAPGAPIMIGPTQPEPLTLATLAVCTPDTDANARQDLPLLGVQILKDEPSGDTDTHVDVPLGSDTKKKRKKQPATDPYAVGILKADDEQQIVYGIVLQPDIPDSQGDICTPAEIEKAAHHFLYNRVPLGLQHAMLAPDDVRPVESYLAPVDFTIDTPRGPETVRKGSWIVAAHIPDPQLWQLAKSEFTGWSVAGTGRRTPLTR
jgi:Putative phage serine protease XkdF/2'-5' RNA ligase superfamily